MSKVISIWHAASSFKYLCTIGGIGIWGYLEFHEEYIILHAQAFSSIDISQMLSHQRDLELSNLKISNPPDM